MCHHKLTWGILLGLLGAAALAVAQSPEPRVNIYDHGQTATVAGPGAPTHIIGMTRISHDISLDTGVAVYGLRYIVAIDPDDPEAAIPGEGYVGMPRPLDANWYSGGFFDLKLNGATIGDRRVQAFTGRTLGDRGYIDYVFDGPQALVRLRFVGLAGNEGLFLQVLLEPKVELTQINLSLRCYPAGFINGPSRQALSSVRQLETGTREALDLDDEWWLHFFDTTRDESGGKTGPCSVLWLPEQMDEVTLQVGSYAVSTEMKLKPERREFRFIFFDHTGLSNDEAQTLLKERSSQWKDELATLTFTDTTVLNWSLTDKMAETRQLLAVLPDNEKRLDDYEKLYRELEGQLQQLRESAPTGVIQAEAAALKSVLSWEQTLPQLRLEALLNSF
jgi:hypothetical protein